MKPEDNGIDDLFRERFRDFAPVPSPEVWSRIGESLDRKKAVRRMILYRWSGVAALLLLALITGVLLTREPATLPVAEKLPALRAPESILPQRPGGKMETAGIREPRRVNDSKATIAENSKPAAAGTETPAIPLPEAVRIEFASVAGPAESGMPPPELLVREDGDFILVIREKHPLLTEPLKSPGSDQLLAGAKGNGKTASAFRPEWRIGVQLSPSYASHTSDYSAEYAKTLTAAGSRSATGVGAGISVQVKTSRRWMVESGLYYSRNGDKSPGAGQLFSDKAEYAYFAVGDSRYYSNAVSLQNGQLTMNSTAGIIRISQTPRDSKLVNGAVTAIGMNSTLLTTGEFFQVFDFMEVPVTARYRLFDSKMDLDLLGGVSANFVVGNQVMLETSGSSEYVGRTGDIAPFGISGSAGFGIIYPLSKKISITVEPRASYWLSSLNKGSDVTFRPWKVGIYSGLTFGF
jgi:hypothetical protein